MPIVAIHQPNYLPWLGFFDKLLNSDIFILLDDAQIQKTGGSWVNRVQINSRGKSQWLTVPISRSSGFTQIRDASIADDSWSERHLAAVDAAYKSAPFFNLTRSWLIDLYACRTQSLADFNVCAIQRVLDLLGIEDFKKCVLSSSLKSGHVGSRRLADLVQCAGGDSYLSGRGSTSYLDVDVFRSCEIDLVFQDFKESIRPQLATESFLPGLSIIDSLMMIGPDETIAELRRSHTK